MKKAVFLDRDWTLNKDNWYTYKVEDLALIDENIPSILKYFKNKWYLLIIVTNQSWIDRGYYKEEDFWKFMRALENKIWFEFDAIYFASNHPDISWDSSFRKPNNWMLLKAQKDFSIDLSKSFMVWDSESDILVWKKSWCKTILLWKKFEDADFIVSSWLEIKNIIL